MPFTAEVRYCYDGASRGSVDTVHLANGGHVLLMDADERTYYDKDKPK
jgi:hypothetical protein